MEQYIQLSTIIGFRLLEQFTLKFVVVFSNVAFNSGSFKLKSIRQFRADSLVDRFHQIYQPVKELF